MVGEEKDQYYSERQDGSLEEILETGGIKDKKYERWAVGSDVVAATGFAMAMAACDLFPYNFFLGVGTAVSGMQAIVGDQKSDWESIQVMKGVQPVMGTIAGLLSVGYYLLGDLEMGTIMGGLSLACYSSTLSQILRDKKKTDDPNYRGLVGILARNEKE